MSKKTSKSPYDSYSGEELMAVERDRYYIQIGHDMLESETGKTAFNKDRAEQLFFEILDSLKHMRDKGSPEEKEDALQCLMHFRIHQLRIH